MEATIITLAKTQEPDGHTPLRTSHLEYQDAVLGLSYIALILNVGSILSALKVVDGVGRIAYRNGVIKDDVKSDLVPHWPSLGPNKLMATFGVKGRIRFLMWHCRWLIPPLFCLGSVLTMV